VEYHQFKSQEHDAVDAYAIGTIITIIIVKTALSGCMLP
jgi:hypothetical protein